MAVSIDIGTRAVQILSGQVRKSGHIALKENKLIMVPADILTESKNERQNSIFSLIKPVLSAMNVRHADCSFTLSDDRFLIRELKLPKAPDKELRNIAKQEMINLYSAAEDDIVEIDNIVRLPDNSISVRAAAFGKVQTDGYWNFAIDASMNPRSLGFHSSSISKLAATKPDVNGSPIGSVNVILADMGMFACIVHAISSGKSVFSRYLPVGFGELSHALMLMAYPEMMAHPEMMMHPDDQGGAGVLQSAILQGNILRDASFDYESSVHRSYPQHIAQQIELFFSKLADELTKTLRFLISSKIINHIDAIYLFGGGSQIHGLAQRLGRAVNIRTEDVETISTISAPDGIHRDLPYLLNCVGSLL